MPHRRLFVTAVLAAALTMAGALAPNTDRGLVIAQEITAGPLVLSDLWTRATPPGAPTGAGYLTIANPSSTPDRLVSVRSSGAATVELHVMRMDGDRALMRPAPEGIDIPAEATVTLAPGGFHIMFIGLAAPFVEGGEVAVTLVFERAGEVEAPMPVMAIGARGPTHAGHGAAAGGR